MPSAVGLSAHAGNGNGRVAGENYQHKRRLRNFQFQAIYVPPTDLTDPAPATTFSFLDAFTRSFKACRASVIYPAVASAGKHKPCA